jgi:hypothetical protein
MSNQANNLPIQADDGFGDALDADRVIQGSIIKCVDGHWSDREGVPFPAETKMLAMSTAICLQHWKDGQPVDTIIKRPGQSLPDVDELNGKIPKKEWELGLDKKPRPPWERQFVVYLVREDDASIFTFINSTKGAEIAFDRLKSKVTLKRQLSGANNILPVVQLDNRPMKTDYGQKLRPEFTVVEWRQLGSADVNASPARIEHQPDEEVSYDERFADEDPRTA